MAPPAILTTPLPELQFVPYTVVWVLMVLAIDAAVLRGLLRRAPEGLAHPAVRLWTLGVPLLGVLAWSRFDLFPAIAAMAAVLYAGSRRPEASGAAAGLGAALKLWPALLAPIQRTRAMSVRASAVALGVVAAIAGVTFQLTGSNGFASVLGYQSDRGLQIESVAALPMVWLRAFGVDGYDAEFRFGAWEIVGPGVAQVADIASVVFLVALVLIGLGHWRLMKVDAGRRGVALTAVSLMLVILVTNKVFSPQYVLWLLALMCAASLLDPATWRPFVKPMLALAALTQVVFPLFYGDIVSGSWPGPIALTVRDALLLWLTAKVLMLFWQEVRGSKLREAALADADAINRR
jgi:hypothetical protein